MRRPGGPGVTGHAPFVGGQTSQSPSGPLQCRAAPHQTTVGEHAGQAHVLPPPRPCVSRGPRGQRRIRRACFSFTGASWVLMALLMLMACGGHRAQRSEAHQAAFPGNTDRASSCRTGTQAGTGVLASYADPASEDTRSSERGGTRSAEPPGAFGGWGTRTKACAGGSPTPVCDLRALGSPRKARPPGPGERSGRVPVACSGLVRLWEKLPDLGPHDTPRMTQAAPTLLRRGPGR